MQLAGVTVTLTAIVVFVMHSRMLVLENELRQAKLKVVEMERMSAHRSSHVDVGMCRSEMSQPLPGTTTTSGAEHNSSIFIAGYDSATALQAAVIAGIDVRCIILHATLLCICNQLGMLQSLFSGK